jgi:hypothetical protein
MLTDHLVLFYVLAFDAVIGTLLARYLWLWHATRRRAQLRASWLAIVGLVNISGLFCSAHIVEAVAGLGGLAVTIVLLSALSAVSRPEKTS